MTNIKVKKIDPLSERLDKVGLRGGFGKSSRPTLNKKDKQVIDAFYKGKEASSNKLISDGKTLEKMGLGAQKIAKRDKGEFGDFNITAKTDSKSTQSILRYIKKTFPKDRIKKDTTKMVKKKNKGGLLVTPKLAQRGF
jgi:hypothetical protein